MIPNHTQFLDAIHQKKSIRIGFYSRPDGGVVDRECAPLDYGPIPGTADAPNRYWIWDPAHTAGGNPLGLLSDQIVSVQILGTDFDPHTLNLGTRAWCVPRDWAPQPELAGARLPDGAAPSAPHLTA